MSRELQRRRHILLTMLAAARFQYAGPPPELVRLLRGWFDSGAGIGRIVGGRPARATTVLLRADASNWVLRPTI